VKNINSPVFCSPTPTSTKGQLVMAFYFFVTIGCALVGEGVGVSSVISHTRKTGGIRVLEAGNTLDGDSVPTRAGADGKVAFKSAHRRMAREVDQTDVGSRGTDVADTMSLVLTALRDVADLLTTFEKYDMNEDGTFQ
jgi:hypothetical protein